MLKILPLFLTYFERVIQMREIKFRAWDKVNNKWMSVADLDEEIIINPYTSTSRAGQFSISEWNVVHRVSEDLGTTIILMQYTGLKDCHGKEIFQGDILKDEAGRARTVVFDYGAFKVMWNNDNPTQMNLYPFNKHWEVIGNIHENPEDLAAQPQKGE